jgi:hypothetical protein
VLVEDQPCKFVNAWFEEYSSLEHGMEPAPAFFCSMKWRLFMFSLNLKTSWLVNSFLQIDPVTEWHGTPSAVIWSRENRLMLLVFPFFSPISTRHWRWKSCQVSLLANANLNVFFWTFLLSLSFLCARQLSMDTRMVLIWSLLVHTECDWKDSTLFLALKCVLVAKG